MIKVVPYVLVIGDWTARSSRSPSMSSICVPLLSPCRSIKKSSPIGRPLYSSQNSLSSEVTLILGLASMALIVTTNVFLNPNTSRAASDADKIVMITMMAFKNSVEIDFLKLTETMTVDTGMMQTLPSDSSTLTKNTLSGLSVSFRRDEEDRI